LKTILLERLENGAVLAVGEIDATVAEMLERLETEQAALQEYSALKSEKKKREWLGVRLLLREILGVSAYSLRYDDQGKPFLENPSRQISISHSGKYICVLVEKHRSAGVDIQVFKTNISKGLSLFMSEQELRDCSGQQNDLLLHVYWGAKEAAFKFLGLKNTDIKIDIYILPFIQKKTGKLEARIAGRQKPLRLEYRIANDYVLVFTC
jgi:4'-phosphopantetheinyl transferase